MFYVFFFFSSRRRHTRWPRDWSSDVCSSDLPPVRIPPLLRVETRSDGSDGVCKIGRASCRERVSISVVAVSLKKKTAAAASIDDPNRTTKDARSAGQQESERATRTVATSLTA